MRRLFKNIWLVELKIVDHEWKALLGNYEVLTLGFSGLWHVVIEVEVEWLESITESETEIFMLIK